MTSARRPAGAPKEEPKPAGAAGHDDHAQESAEPTDRGEPGSDPGGGPPRAADADSAAAVDADLDAMLSDVSRQRDEYLELAKRTKADFENYRKRAAREASDAERRGKAGLARDLVPALDSLERALQAAGVGDDGSEADGGKEAPSREVSAHEALAQGVSLVLRELRQTLARAGVEAFDPKGDAFDPTWHEVLSTRPGDGGSGVILETLEKGYRVDGQLIRPARVVVSE